MSNKRKKIDKLDFIKMENFYDSNDILKKCKDSPQNGRTYFYIMSDNGLYLEHT